MATQTKRRPGAAAPNAEAKLPAGLPQLPPETTEERLRSIEAMSQRINEYVQFMCKAGDLHGTSAEAKDKAIAAFHDRMATLERQLGRIQEELRLG
jgi:hypothetical protein